MTGRQVGCAGHRDELDHYFDDGFAGRGVFDAHAMTCPDCRAAFAAMVAELADLPCNVFVELVTDYLERSTTPIDRDRIDRHLELCEGCRSYFQQMRWAIQLSAATDASPPDPRLRDTLTAAFRAIRSGR